MTNKSLLVNIIIEYKKAKDHLDKLVKAREITKGDLVTLREALDNSLNVIINAGLDVDDDTIKVFESAQDDYDVVSGQFIKIDREITKQIKVVDKLDAVYTYRKGLYEEQENI